MKSNEDFNFFVPIEVIEKSHKDKKGNEVKEMIIEGIASTADTDADGEILEPSGYILDRFLSNGTLNFEHLGKKNPKYIVGEPIDAYVKDDKMYLKGKLWSNSEIGQEIYKKIKEIKDSGSNRRAGFSIEGKAISRDIMNPKRITKALITNCAITFSPTNQNALIDVVKGTQKEDFIELQREIEPVESEHIFEFEKDGKKYGVGKDFIVREIKLEKAMDTTNTAPLVPESLDKKPKNIVDITKAIKTISKYKNIFGNEFNKKIQENIKNIF